MEWLFDGIGTEIALFIIGNILGVVEHKLYISKRNRNKQWQKAGNGAIQIQSNGNTIISKPDEFDICNFSYYSNSQIEDVIAKGNNATIRKWCLELILNQKPDYLILQCIEKMDNNQEKYKLLEELSARNFDSSKYFEKIIFSLTNEVYRVNAIKLCILRDKMEYIEPVFFSISNNKYKYDSLVEIYNYNNELFKKLYDAGNCFENRHYKVKMREWLKRNMD